MADETLAIVFERSATGCLPGLLAGEIRDTERLLEAASPDDPERVMVEVYLGQLRSCRTAVVAARDGLLEEARRKAGSIG